MKQFMGKSEFNRQLLAFYNHAKVTQEMVQALIEDGLLFAMHPSQGGCGDLSRLDKVIYGCRNLGGMPTRTIQRYIQEHTDVKWCKKSDGTYGFKFNGAPDANMPSVPYWEWEGNTESKPKPDVDIVKRIKSLLTQAKNAEKQGKKVEHPELIPELETMLRKATAQVHTEDA